jgi:protein involved in polysaccharide export with SLBB domain
LVRNGQLVPIDFDRLVRNGDTSENIYLQNNDYIYLPSGSGARAYVLGAVNQPRVVDFREHMTLSEAISNAGGFAHGSYPEHVVLIRDSLVNPEVAVINVNAIIHGKATDVALEPKDIVWVPNAPWQRVENYVGDILSTFARTVAANEGARAASPQAQPVGLDLGISGSGPGGASAYNGPAQNSNAESLGGQ